MFINELLNILRGRANSFSCPSFLFYFRARPLAAGAGAADVARERFTSAALSEDAGSFGSALNH